MQTCRAGSWNVMLGGIAARLCTRCMALWSRCLFHQHTFLSPVSCCSGPRRFGGQDSLASEIYCILPLSNSGKVNDL
ncbi:hypothetical protein EDB19DRAFT_1685264 [Suillus lakei]|nr:hypothetical protein EDB19DRAFT_1685264 [Suillus lakei]